MILNEREEEILINMFKRMSRKYNNDLPCYLKVNMQIFFNKVESKSENIKEDIEYIRKYF